MDLFHSLVNLKYRFASVVFVVIQKFTMSGTEL